MPVPVKMTFTIKKKNNLRMEEKKIRFIFIYEKKQNNKFKRGACSPFYTGVAQLVEYWSPKPLVVGSNPTARANTKKGVENKELH